MKLVVKGIEYECVYAAKTKNEVKIVDVNGETTIFSGIENISDYVLEGGEWDAPEPSAESVLLEIAADHEERLCMMELGI